MKDLTVGEPPIGADWGLDADNRQGGGCPFKLARPPESAILTEKVSAEEFPPFKETPGAFEREIIHGFFNVGQSLGWCRSMERIAFLR